MSRKAASRNRLTAYALRVFLSLLFLSLLPLASIRIANAQTAGVFGFDYADRTALLADGWDFLARTSGGGTRNTEQTSGSVVDYNQTTHPGTIRIPASLGTLWGSSNDTRNTIFRDLPSDWTTIRLAVASFAPTALYQGACLMAYQDDQSYVSLCRNFTGSQTVDWWWETGGSPATISTSANSATTNMVLRLDRVPSTNAITAFVSVNGGSSWTQMSGTVVKALTNPRLSINVGESASGSTFPNADLAYVEIGTTSTPLPTTLAVSASTMNFSGVAGGSNPANQTLNITSNGSPLNWTATDNQTWLSVSPGSGTTPGTVTVSVNTAGLAAGTYNGTITVTASGATNSPLSVAVTLTVSTAPPPSSPHIDLNYSSRAALLAAGWDFLARTSGGGTRNTEQTSGSVVDYNQTTHPGTIRIPASLGTLWGSNNDTRNTLFRDLPSDWTTIRLAVASFAPTALYQGACLMAYQDDQSYVSLCRNFTGSQTVDWWWETGGSPATISTSANSATTNMVLRLDRVPSTNAITAFVSVNGGSSWTQMSGTVVKALTNPRLSINVGESASGSTFPNADLAYVEIGTTSTPLPTTLAVSASTMNFSGVAGGSNPANQTLNITSNGSPLNWTATDNQTWLSVSPGSGTTPGTATVSVNTAGLAAGTYNGAITVTASGATNSPLSVAVTLTVSTAPPPSSPHIDLNYSSRAALLAAGWDFLARTSGGGTRNTEQTSGSVVDYNQTTHPGTIRIPASLGTLWGSNNDTRNTLFRDLPSDWTTIRLAVASFAPTALYQGACLMAYQDDQSYVSLCRNFTGSQTVDWWWETGGSPATISTSANSATTNMVLRLDRVPSTNAITAFVSVNGGSSWTQMSGSVVKALTNPRLSINVGESASGSTFPNADLAYVEIGTTSTPLLSSLLLSANSLSFLGFNPAPQTVNISSSGSTLNWTATDNQTWLSVTPGTASTPGTITVSVNTTGLSAGTYNGTITVSAPGASNSPVITVTLTVPSTPPTLAVSTNQIAFTTIAGIGNPSGKTFDITNEGGGAINWTAGSNQSWLTATPTSGVAPSSVNVTVDAAGLTVGTYNGGITVSASGASNSPQVVTVNLTVISVDNAGILSAAVLINGSNIQGYDSNPNSPGEFQRYPERYLEHLQVPYDIIDVATTAPSSDLSRRHLIIAGHRGLNPSTAWRDAIVAAVNGGAGFINLDWDSQIGFQSHIQSIFGATGSSVGTPATNVTVPSNVIPGGANAHYIAALQQRYLDTPPGDLVYNFHENTDHVVQAISSTILSGTSGTVIARAGSNPLIVAKAFGTGRAVYFGTLDYLKADRFGFLQGVDDLFWRSLVWAARKPFVIRGYPKFWAVQMDDTRAGWGFRVRDMYNSQFTGNVSQNGTGGPWKVTGYVFTDHLGPGTGERSAVISDINAGLLHVAPHALSGADYGDLYWNASAGQLTDSQWLNKLNEVSAWEQGLGGPDAFPFLSASLVAHYWDLSNNTGFDLWNTMAFRYITSIQKPGFQNPFPNPPVSSAERLHARPFWLYEQPPKTTPNEDQPFFFADDYQIGSRSGLPTKTFFLFATQLQGINEPRFDLTWPVSTEWTAAQSVDRFKRHTWRFWSSFAPMQIFTHDWSNYEASSAEARQAVITNLSQWLNGSNVRHVFMEELGDYIYARTKSKLTRAYVTENGIICVFVGNATTADGAPVTTDLQVYLENGSETSHNTQGFEDGDVVTLPIFLQ